ncbi:hypothetical protein ACJMK2_035900 [Sinanodonta woodiana]|uniref:Protein kintoun n=1 Tax=Sinanodonta woodiana TaxID=1069815 RepID=A0ABD3WFH4_SINWO
MASKRDGLEDLNLTQDEIQKFEKAFKDEKFRQLFIEYAEEISNPENKKRYEEEITLLEQERGMDVEFIHPEPGHVLKTTADGKQKAFINICKNEKIGKPTSERKTLSDGKSGLSWQIPHSFAPPMENLDKGGKKCVVFDVVFHPDTYRMAESNERFKKIVEDTAVEGIEKQFGVKLDKANIKSLKIKYKGKPTPTVLRQRRPEGPKPQSEDDILKDMPYPYDGTTSAEKAEQMRKEVEKKEAERKKKEDKTKMYTDHSKSSVTEPKYSIIHRSQMDLQEYRNAPDARPSTRPKELEIKIELPLLSSAAQVSLDVFEERLVLESKKPAEYKLDLKLPYPVDEDRGTAKFDKSKSCLVVTLPVQPPLTPQFPFSVTEEISNGHTNVDTDHDQTASMRNNNDEATCMIEDITDQQMVTELPPIEDMVTEKDKQMNKTTAQDDTDNTSSLDTPKSSSKISYLAPVYDINQDRDTLTFVLHARNIKQDSVSKIFKGTSTVQVRFISLGSGGFPMHYSLYVKFPEDCKIVPEYSSVDISEHDLVVVLLKEKECRMLWDKFEAGPEESKLEEKFFVTESNIHKELTDLESEAEIRTMVQTETTEQDCTLEVTAMNKSKLTVNIKKCRHEDLSDVDLEYDDCPSSAEIKVVHEKEFPMLQGILKQRSVSESSEESSSSGSSPSRSGSKSVSFSSHVDKTTYKPNQAVTSMKQALKSKRKRQRKMQEKKHEKGRKRHGSTGSESSSSDEPDMKFNNELHSEEEPGEKEEIQEEDVDFKEKEQYLVHNVVIGTSSSEIKYDSGVEKRFIADNNVIGTSSSEEIVDCEKYKRCIADDNVIGTSNSEVNVGSASVEAYDSCMDVKAKLITQSTVVADNNNDIVDEFRTRECKKKQDVFDSDALPQMEVGWTKRTKSNSEEDKNVFSNDLAQGDVEPIPKDGRQLQESSGATAQSTGKKGRKRRKRKNKNRLANQDESSSTGDNSASSGDQGVSDGEEIKSASSSESDAAMHDNGFSKKKIREERFSVESGSNNEREGEGDADKEKLKRNDVIEKNGREKSDVETVLSWKDVDGSSNEHKTMCGFKFLNNVMFDLDVE